MYPMRSDSSYQLDMTQGSLYTKIFVYSLPLIFSNLLQVLFNMADIAVVGRFSGAAALGSVGSCAILVTMFTYFIIGIGNGLNVKVALFTGAKRDKDVSEYVQTGFLLALFLGFFMLAVGELFSPAVLRLMNTQPELIDGAVLYLRIYFLGMPAMGIYNFGNGVLSAIGDTRRPLLFLTCAGVLNIVLNLVTVIGLHWSVAGVAVASAVSQCFSAVLILRTLLKTRESYGLRLAGIRLIPEKLKGLLIIALPAGLQGAIFAFANLFVQAGINSLGTLMVEGNSAATNADGIVYDVMAAFYTACTSFMSQNLGAGKKERVIASYRIGLGYSFAAGLVLGVGLVLLGRPFLSLFTTEPEVIEAGMLRLRIMGLSYCVSAFMDCTIAGCRGLGETVVPTFMVIMGSCVFRILWIFTIFRHFQTVPSLYLLYVFSWTITAACEYVYFRRILKRTFAGGTV